MVLCQRGVPLILLCFGITEWILPDLHHRERGWGQAVEQTRVMTHRICALCFVSQILAVAFCEIFSVLFTRC